jgi:ABC-2 type transport system permease protein
MPIDNAHYHGWQGSLRSPWLATLALVRVALLQVLRRKLYWIVLALGLAQFFLYWSIIYAVTQLDPPPAARERMLEAFGFSAQPQPGRPSGYVLFMERQSVVVMILLAFSGSVLVGSDFRLGSLPFYLSRRIDRRHYIVGKLLAVGAVVSLLTTVPALILFIEYGMFTSSTDYWIDNWRLPVEVIAYGAVLAVTLSVLLVTLSAYLQRLAPIAITWSSLFVLLPLLRSALVRETHNRSWNLIDPWHNMSLVGRLAFDGFDSTFERRLALWALAILAVVSAAMLVALVRRVRSVDVVE